MATCTTFYSAFRENMQALGLPAPTSLFDVQQTATGTLATILGTLNTLGPNATVGELIGATTGLELLAVAAAISATFHAGAVAGSLMVASGTEIACKASIAGVGQSVRLWAGRNHVDIPANVYEVLQLYPDVFNPGPHSRRYAQRAYVHRKAVA